MTNDRLIDILSPLPDNRWASRPPADEESVAALERQYDLHLPSDYRGLLLRSNGGSIGGKDAAINLEPVEMLMSHNLDPRFVADLPGMFVIGDDGGGAVYYYDPDGRHGKGDWALFLIPLGELGSGRQRFAGRSLTSAAERALAGESFFE
jgi:hypothetical protein